MNPIKTHCLSWLMHHANRHTKSEHFYKIKKDLLAKHGKFLQYDVQFLEGKKCHTCGGGGLYYGVSYNTGYEFTDTCNRCAGSGWYKYPVWNILEKSKFGKYSFHTPWKRSYTKPDVEQPIIKGYIEHNYTKHGEFALTVLYIIFDRKRWWQQWKKDVGFGWRSAWYKPRNWIHNIAHLIKKGPDAIPVNNFKRIIQKLSAKFGNNKQQQVASLDSDLPF